MKIYNLTCVLPAQGAQDAVFPSGQGRGNVQIMEEEMKERFVRVEQSNFGLEVWKRAISRGVDTMRRPLTAVYRVELGRMFWVNLTQDCFVYYAGCVPIRFGAWGQVFKMVAPGILGVTERNGQGDAKRRIYICGLDIDVPEDLLRPLPRPEPLTTEPSSAPIGAA